VKRKKKETKIASVTQIGMPLSLRTHFSKGPIARLIDSFVEALDWLVRNPLHNQKNNVDWLEKSRRKD